MVAEVQPQAQPESPPKTREKPSKADKPVLRSGIPLIARMQVRNLYLSQALTYKEIAQRTGLRLPQVEKIIHHDGLAVQRRKKTAELRKRTDARVDATFEEFEQVAARESEEIILGGLQNAKATLSAGHEDAPKHFQAWTAGISNLVKVSRTMRGLDQPQAQAGAGTTNIALQLFCVQGDLAPAKPEPTRVQPLPLNANDVVSTEPIRGENTLT